MYTDQTTTNPLQKDIYHFGLDMLEVLGTFPNEEQFFKMQIGKMYPEKFEEFIITRFDANNYLYKIEFKLENIPMFAYYKGNRKDFNYHGVVKTSDYFCFYSSAFRHYSELGVFRLLDRLGKPSRFDCVKRFDLCMDIPFSTNEVFKTFNTVNITKTMFYGKNDEIETFYIGAKKNTENKHSLLRIYNKHKDIHAKDKVKYYKDYFQYDNMTRLEMEVRRELCKNVNLGTIFDPKTQMDIFLTQFTKYTNIFSGFKYDHTSLFRKKEQRDWETLSNFDKTRRVKMFLAYAEKIAVVLGICPLQILLEKRVFLDTTITMINKYGINEYINIVHRNNHWNKNINKILDHKSLYDSDSGI